MLKIMQQLKHKNPSAPIQFFFLILSFAKTTILKQVSEYVEKKNFLVASGTAVNF